MTDSSVLLTTTDKQIHQARNNHKTATSLKDVRKWRERYKRLENYYRFLELLREFHPEYRRQEE